MDNRIQKTINKYDNTAISQHWVSSQFFFSDGHYQHMILEKAYQQHPFFTHNYFAHYFYSRYQWPLLLLVLEEWNTHGSLIDFVPSNIQIQFDSSFLVQNMRVICRKALPIADRCSNVEQVLEYLYNKHLAQVVQFLCYTYNLQTNNMEKMTKEGCVSAVFHISTQKNLAKTKSFISNQTAFVLAEKLGCKIDQQSQKVLKTVCCGFYLKPNKDFCKGCPFRLELISR